MENKVATPKLGVFGRGAIDMTDEGSAADGDDDNEKKKKKKKKKKRRKRRRRTTRTVKQL